MQIIINPTMCKYKKYCWKLKEQFINDLNDEAITAEIIKELNILKDTTKVSSV